MDRERAYQMPFERLLKFGRSAGRKAYPVSWGAFFLIPDRAFADVRERSIFIGEVFGRLGAEARERSQKHVRLALETIAAATGA